VEKKKISWSFFRYAENARQEKKSFVSYLQTNSTSTLHREGMDQLEEKIQFVSIFFFFYK
jgi:hypothetical protein